MVSYCKGYGLCSLQEKRIIFMLKNKLVEYPSSELNSSHVFFTGGILCLIIRCHWLRFSGSPVNPFIDLSQGCTNSGRQVAIPNNFFYGGC